MTNLVYFSSVSGNTQRKLAAASAERKPDSSWDRQEYVIACTGRLRIRVGIRATYIVEA